MTVRTERGWWIALLLAAAVGFHLFMLTGVPGRPAALESGHGDRVPAALHDVSADGPGGLPAGHSARDMLSLCLAVLSLVAAGTGFMLLGRRERTGSGLDGRKGVPLSLVDRLNCRDGPAGSSRVDAGVLLRV